MIVVVGLIFVVAVDCFRVMGIVVGVCIVVLCEYRNCWSGLTRVFGR